MRRASPQIALWLVSAALLAGCNGTAGAASGPDAGPRAWIDAPLDGSTLPLGPVAVVAHGAAQGGLAQAEFSVNGLAFLNPEPAQDPAMTLVTWHQVWEPTEPGSYQIQVRVQNQEGNWSPPAQANVTIRPAETPTPTVTPTPEPSPTPTCSLRAQFVRDVSIPDGTMFAPGTPFTKTWRLRNAGDCVWGGGYSLVFVSGSQMGAPTQVPLPGTVSPDTTVDVSVNLVAPPSLGQHRGLWMLQDNEGRIFGIGDEGETAFWVDIVVGVTPTPAPDTQAPAVNASHSPPGASLPVGTSVTINASASDNLGVERIEIWISYPRGGPQLVQTCSNATNCAYQNTFSAGTISYYARAYDAAGNMSSTGLIAITFYYVVQ